MKKAVSLFVAIMLVLSVFTALPVYANEKVEISFKVGDSTLSINGKEVQVETPYVVGEGTTLVPLRVITEAFGAVVGWEEATQKITLEYPDVNIVLQIGNKEVIVNEHTETLLAAPELPKDTTMVPLRFISETFGATVTYDEKTELITVTKEADASSSTVEGITEKEKVGDSYYNWSIDTPTELFMQDRTFDGISTTFSDDEGNLLIISIDPTNELTFDELYNDFKKVDVKETLIIAEKHTDRYGNQYMQLRKKDAKEMKEMYIYFAKNGTVYCVNVIGDVKSDLNYIFDIAATFTLDFVPATTHNLSNVVSNMRTYENEKYKISFKVPANWMSVSDIAENKAAFVCLDKDSSALITLSIYSLSNEVNARFLANHDLSYNAKYPSQYTKTTPVSSSLIGNNILSYQYVVSVDGTENDDYCLTDVFFERGDYLYNIAIQLDEKQNKLVTDILSSIKAEVLDKNEIGILLRDDLDDDTKPREVTEGIWTATIPALWKDVQLGSITAYENQHADALLTIGAESAVNVDLGLLRGAVEEQLNSTIKNYPGSSTVKNTYAKKLAGHTFYTYAVKIAVKDTDESQIYVFYATVKDNAIITVGCTTNEAHYGDALIAELDEIVQSITINKQK